MKIFIKTKIITKILPTILIAILLVGLVFIFQTDTKKVESAWYGSGGSWVYRKPITIDNTKVSGGSALSNFPMLFSVTDTDLKDTTNGGKMGKSDGTDMLFTSSDGTTKLSHEIASYNSTTGEVTVWVKIPSLSNSVDTTIYVYYGNASAADQQDITGTWNSNYVGVYHMNEDPSGTAPQVLDSTSNNYDLTSAGSMTSGDLVAGKFDSAIDYDGSDDKLTNGSVTGVSGYPITVSAWSKATTGDNGTQRSVAGIGNSIANNDYVAVGWSSTTGKARAAVRTGGSYNSIGTGTVIGTDIWTHIVAVFRSATDREYYVDGVSKGSATLSVVAPTFSAIAVGGAYGGSSVFATIDEARILTTSLSADWITTEYNNQSATSTFYTYSVGDTSETNNTGGSIKVVKESSGNPAPAVKLRGGVKFR